MINSLRKNILIVLPFFTLGGAETQALHVAKAFKKARHNVTIIAFEKKNGELIDKLNEFDIDWAECTYNLSLVHTKGLKKVIELLSFIRFLRTFKPDYIFPFTYYPNILCSAVWRFTGAQMCFWNQRGMESLNPILIERLAKASKPNYLANAKTCAEFIAKRHHFDVNQVNVIPNAVHPSPPAISKDKLASELSLSVNNFTCIMVANFFPEKNHTYLLNGWKLFTEKYPQKNPKLFLVGYSPAVSDIEKIKALAYDLRLQDSLHFISSYNDIPALLQSMQVGILTSSSEGCPNTVLEYLYAKIPAIISKISATEELFDHNYPLFVDLNNEHSLYLALEKCLDEKFRNEISDKNVHIIKNKYNRAQLEESYLNLLNH